MPQTCHRCSGPIVSSREPCPRCGLPFPLGIVPNSPRVGPFTEYHPDPKEIKDA
jgi:hypothetical protein